MRIAPFTLLSLSLALTACGRSPEAPAPAPALATQAAPTPSTAPVASTAPKAASAAPASSAAAPSSVAAAATAAPAAGSSAGPEVAGDVAVAEGNVTDTAADGSTRQLKDGDSVYPGDAFTLGDDSYLDLDLTDTGRILLRPNTSFQIQKYHFEPEAHPGADGTPAELGAPAQPENAFFRLVKGGLRAVDGIIGHTTPQNYAVDTPVATIGVRGTAFDVRYCGDDCKDEADSSGAPQNGLYTSVSEGSVGVKNDSGETVSQAGQSGYVADRHQRPQALKTPPKALRHMALPERLKARDQAMHGKIRTRQQQRRQQKVQRHRSQAAARAKAGGAAPGKETPAEHRKQRQEQQGGGRSGKDKQENRQEKPQAQQRKERQQQREQRQKEQRERREQQPAAQQQGGMTPAERRQQRREERQQGQGAQPQGGGQGKARREEREQRQEKAGAAAQGGGKQDKPDQDKCKGKKGRRAGKKCGGG